jgi:hypothetical protein
MLALCVQYRLDYPFEPLQLWVIENTVHPAVEHPERLHEPMAGRARALYDRCGRDLYRAVEVLDKQRSAGGAALAGLGGEPARERHPAPCRAKSGGARPSPLPVTARDREDRNERGALGSSRPPPRLRPAAPPAAGRRGP